MTKELPKYRGITCDTRLKEFRYVRKDMFRKDGGIVFIDFNSELGRKLVDRINKNWRTYLQFKD
jgi:hypothetical protein